MIGRGLIFSEDSNLVAQNNFPQASRSVRKLHTKSSCKSTCALSQFSARRRREHLNAYTCPCAPQTPLTHNGTKVAILSVARVQSINVGFSKIRRGRIVLCHAIDAQNSAQLHASNQEPDAPLALSFAPPETNLRPAWPSRCHGRSEDRNAPATNSSPRRGGTEETRTLPAAELSTGWLSQLYRLIKPPRMARVRFLLWGQSRQRASVAHSCATPSSDVSWGSGASASAAHGANLPVGILN
jgi:hypothetical protein